MPTLGHFPLRSADAPIEHDWCRATDLCRRCGASVKAVEQAVRALYCEPGVTGISWARRAERIRDLMWPWGGLATSDNIKPLAGAYIEFGESPEITQVPVYRLEDFVPPLPPSAA